MKKYYIIPILAAILLLPVASVSAVPSIDKVETQASSCGSNEDFTHTVIVEYGAMTTCPHCVTASNQLYNIYNSGDLDFYYVSLVWNEGNLNVRGRLGQLGVSSVPDVFFDGKYSHLIGAQSDEQPYRNKITQAGTREVPDIDINVEVSWKGGGTLKIVVTVINNEAEDYNGHLRTYIVEKESRWNDNSGNPFHYAVLDIPLDRDLSVRHDNPMPLGDTYTFTKTWFGSLRGFGDITKENILVIASVFDPDSDYAVQTASAEPTGTTSYYRPVNLLLLRLLERFPLLERLLNLL